MTFLCENTYKIESGVKTRFYSVKQHKNVKKNACFVKKKRERERQNKKKNIFFLQNIKT